MTNILNIDNYDLTRLSRSWESSDTTATDYVVTPNVDHVIRHYEDLQFRALYANASYVLLDSRFLAHMVAVFKRQILRVCLGSDLTSAVFSSVLKPFDVAVMVGGPWHRPRYCGSDSDYGASSYRSADELHSRPYRGRGMPARHRGRKPVSFLFFGDRFSSAGDHRAEAEGTRYRAWMALCIGAAINFMTGIERRAPVWVQNSGLECCIDSCKIRDGWRSATWFAARVYFGCCRESN